MTNYVTERSEKGKKQDKPVLSETKESASICIYCITVVIDITICYVVTCYVFCKKKKGRHR